MPAPDAASNEAALHQLLDALTAADNTGTPEVTPRTCALCRLVRHSVEQSLRAFFAEFVNDPQARTELRTARGFCAEHTALLTQMGDALAVSILYSDLARLTRERWQQTPPASLRARRGWSRLVSGSPAVCPACNWAREAEARYVGALAASLHDPRVWSALEVGSELCVTHIEQTASRAAPVSAARLLTWESERLAALQAELDEIIRKHDYRFRGEPWGPEKDAWLRALQQLIRPDSV